MSGEELTQALRDAGCGDAAAKEFMQLYTEGQTAKAQKLLSRHRKELLDGIHAEERKISCLDYLEYTLRKGEQA
ncbi:MAG: hypothetical protein IJV40_09820 [Oscillospiraceae bacterium]|nr:hypothetical protein [Oscillospiraceae bacterium]